MNAAGGMALQLDAEALYAELLIGVRGLLQPGAALVGIWSGGAWLAERLHADLGLPGRPGVISSTLHRDDFGSRGLAAASATHLPFEIEGRPILLVDDVLFTGRTIRAALDELADFGRPARIMLAVLVDRGGRELPIQPDVVGKKVEVGKGGRVDVFVPALDGRDEVVVLGGDAGA